MAPESYLVQVVDKAGNVTTVDAPAVLVDNCDPPVICMQSAEAPDLAVYMQTKPTGWFLVPPGPGDQHVDDPSPFCPFAPGDRIAGVVGNGVALTFYDVNRGSTDLRVRADALAGNPDLILDFTP